MGRIRKMDSPDFPPDVGEDEENDHVSQTNPKTKRTCYSIPNGFLLSLLLFFFSSFLWVFEVFSWVFSFLSSDGESAIEAMFSSPESWSQMEALLRGLVREEVHRSFESHLQFFLPSSSQLDDHQDGEGMATGSKNFKLCFLNQIPSVIFTNKDIEAKNGEPLKVALIDVDNSTVSTGPLSIAQLEFVVLDGDLSKFDDKSILTQRTGKRPLLVGNDLKINLKNGVGLIKSLSITDNSSWLRSKQFRLGIRIADGSILAKFPRIEEAVSQPFRVLHHRGEAIKKHCPPKREYKVWRLKGIGKNGVYHKKLASEGIETVDDFLKIYYEKGPTYLKKLLGNRFPKKTWKEMEKKALECVDPEMQNFVASEAMGRDIAFERIIEGKKQRNPNYDNNFLETKFVGFDEEWEKPMFNFEDLSSSLFLSGEAPSSSPHNNHEGRDARTGSRQSN